MAVLKVLFMVIAGTCLTCTECKYFRATNTLQEIESEGYSSGWYYARNLFQTWVIEAADNLNVIMVKIDIDTQSCCDKLELYDGSNSAETSLGVFSGFHSGIHVLSLGRYMYVVFRSDSSVRGRGFKLVFKQVMDKKSIWMVVGIVLAVLLTISCVCVVLLFCGVCKSRNEVAATPLHYEQHQQPVCVTPGTQNQLTPAHTVQPTMYQATTYPNSQVTETQRMNRKIRLGTSHNTMPQATHSNIINSLPPTQHYEKT